MAYARWIVSACGALTLLAGSGGLAQAPGGQGEWRYYNSDAAGSKYSSLDAIDRNNIARLSVAWRHPALDPELRQSVRGLTASNYYRVTPLMAGGRLYVQNAVGLVEALDPANGRVIWTQKPLEPGLAGLTGATVARSIAYWRAAADERLFTVRKTLLFALDARTGEPV